MCWLVACLGCRTVDVGDVIITMVGVIKVMGVLVVDGACWRIRCTHGGGNG